MSGLREPFRGLLSDAMKRAEAAGVSVRITDGYRSPRQQRDAHEKKPGKAAVAGKSRHQLGLAADVEGDVAGFQNYLQPALRSLKSEPFHIEENRSLTGAERAELEALR